MVVHSISAAATPSTTLAFRMKQRKGGAGVSSARRALSALGNNNAQINLRMAESLLTITQDKFMKKWNFDPVNETPLTPGRFQWASVGSGNIGAKPDSTTTLEEPTITVNRDISTCFTLPCQDIPSRVPEPHGTNTITTTTTVAEADSGVESDDSIIEDREVEASVAAKQTTITDFLNPRKRSLSHLEDCLQLPSSKKRLLLAN